MKSTNHKNSSKSKFAISFYNFTRKVPKGEIKQIIQPLEKSKRQNFHFVPSTTISHHYIDLEFEREIEPRWNADTCLLTGKCIRTCKQKAIRKSFGGSLLYLKENCDYCGRCINACSTQSWIVQRKGWSVWVGGKRGRYAQKSINVAEFVPDYEVPDILERTWKWYRKNAKKNERFGDALREGGLSSLNSYIDSVFVYTH